MKSPTVAKKPKFHCDCRASFAIAFSNWRRKSKIPLKAIAKSLGVSISTISTWESGKRFPTGYNFEMLVEYTGLPPCKLFCVMADNCVPAECLLALPKKSFAGKDISKKVDWEDPIWAEMAQKCLGCAVCSYMCPSCSCFDIQDETTGSTIERYRCRDTCQFTDFTLMGAGHNPRPEKKMRVRQRVMHKFKYQMEQFQMLGCTGCGRCVENCPVNIDLRAVLERVAGEGD